MKHEQTYSSLGIQAAPGASGAHIPRVPSARLSSGGWPASMRTSDIRELTSVKPRGTAAQTIAPCTTTSRGVWQHQNEPTR